MKITKVKQRRKTSIAEKGITLVALVVTIIILLILVGVTLNLVLSNNGLIGKAKQGVEIYKNASINEQVDLNLMGDLVDEASGVKKITVGESTIQVTPGIESLKNYYGEEVTSFSSVEGVKWQLFYDDEEYYYLIASYYVPTSTLPDELYNYTKSNSSYIAWFMSECGGRIETALGTIMESEPWKNGSTSSSITSNPLTSKYLTYVGSSQNTETARPNMKAVAYMMDTNKWSNFAGSTSNAKAIGGPTLEMFVKSWNAVHTEESEQLGTYETIDSTNATINGYKVKTGTGSWTDFGTSGDLGTTTNMWCIHRQNEANGMWIASPCSRDFSSLVNVYYTGMLNSSDVYNFKLCGFRPVVFIPKS